MCIKRYMVTENKDIEILIKPKTFETEAEITFKSRMEPRIKLMLGSIDAADLIEDILSKFPLYDAEMQTLILSYLKNFFKDCGMKVVEVQK